MKTTQQIDTELDNETRWQIIFGNSTLNLDNFDNTLNTFTPTRVNMKSLILSGHHLLLTDAIKSLTNRKFVKLFRHAPEALGAKVELTSEYDHTPSMLFTARGEFDIGGGPIVASAASEDLYKSIDLMVRKLDQQLRRRHGLWRSKRKERDIAA